MDTPSGDGHSSTAADSEVINQDDIQPELGSISKLSDKPGCFLCYEGKNGETVNWHSKYSDILIPVLHHGSIARGVNCCRRNAQTLTTTGYIQFQNLIQGRETRETCTHMADTLITTHDTNYHST